MATFITTIKFTGQGEKHIQETTKRAASFRATAKKMGVKVVGQYWTLGDFDGLLIHDHDVGSEGGHRRLNPGDH